jgi:2-keto-4-pentenoate hydratase
MEEATISILASALFEADRSRAPIAPLTDSYPGIGVRDAYAIQLRNVDRALAMGHRVSGKKIGLTSQAMQTQLGVSEPDYGHLFEAMSCDDGNVPTDALIQPKIEAEIAFVLKRGLSGGKVTPEEVIDATDYVCGAFEIVDSRVEGWKIKLADTIADNASSGRYIMGSARLSPKSLCLPDIEMHLYKNGILEGKGRASAVLGDPAASVAWLANCLYGYGVAFNAGEIILSGGITAAPAASKGDAFEAVFTELGSVKALFS